MKINVLDSGLAERAGHHYDFDLKLVRRLVATGHDVHVYSYKWLQDEALADFAPIAPVTRLFHYFHYTDPAEFDAYAPEIVGSRKQTDSLASELATVRAADLWLWPTFDHHELMACALTRPEASVVGCVHYDPGFDARTVSAQLWRLALLTARDNGLKLTLGAIEPELRHRYMQAVPDKRFAVFPQPFDGPPRTVPSRALKRIGFFGHQRGEKGAASLDPLLLRLANDGFEVLYHNSNRNFEPPAHPNITRIGFVDDMAVPLADCDVVVLPYDPEKYRVKGSGVLTQALALGIPAIAPFGTLAGRTVEQYQVGPLFGSVTPAAIVAAIRIVERNYERFARNAIRAGEIFANQHGIERYVSTMLSHAR